MKPVHAGMALASIGMVAFGVYHWFFVAPVVAVFFEGIVWAIAGGAAMGWAYQRTMLDHGRTSIAWGFGFGVLLAATLVPYEIVGLIWGPFPEITTPSLEQILPVVPIALVGIPFAIVIGWLLEGRRKVAWSFVVAVLSIHFMIGGSVANFGGRGQTFLLFVGFVAMEILGGAALAYVASGEEAGGPSSDSHALPVE